MFDNLTARLSRTIESLRGRGRITEENVAETLRETRVALLEADVALPVVKAFIESVKAKALGAEVLSSLTPGQAFVGILHQELVQLMGGGAATWALRAQPPVVVLLAGLQGAGKTTTAAKLARRLIERDLRRVRARRSSGRAAACSTCSSSIPQVASTSMQSSWRRCAISTPRWVPPSGCSSWTPWPDRTP